MIKTKKDTIKSLATHSRDVGSTEIQIGLLTDKAISEKKRVPMLNWEQRYKILTNIKGVYKVVKQNEWDYSKNLLKYKPQIFVHGDDWKHKDSYDYKSRGKVVKILKKINCKLIEIPHTKKVTSWGKTQIGDPINLEIDTLARYVARLANY